MTRIATLAAPALPGKRSALLAAGLLVALLTPAPGTAQIVNILPLLGEEEQEGFASELTGSMSWRTGNVDFLTSQASLLLRWFYDDHRLISSTSSALGVSSGNAFLNRQVSHLRYQYRLHEVVSWEGYLQGTVDHIWRLRVRAIAGTGPQVRAIDKAYLSLAFGLSYLFEYQALSVTDDVGDSGVVEFNHRLSSYAIASLKFSEWFKIVQNLYYQPRFDAWGEDWRMFSQTDVVLKGQDWLAVSWSFLVMYDSRPPETVQSTDTTMLVQLTFSL